MKTGKVYLVGAGPGDPGLITVKGLESILEADVLIYDYLASPVLLKHAKENAEIIYVGKKGGDHTLPQDKISSLLVDKAKNGKNVVRLKGGDPFIFGRGGEEIEVLINNGIPFEIVPGVTSAIAAPAYAGIPLTHREFTATLAFVTGHEDPAKESSNIDWKALSKIGTLVFFMGVKNLPYIAEQLLKNGKPNETPVAVIRWGTTPNQTTVVGNLENIVKKSIGIKAPALIVTGEVVKLRESMQWFENRPLFGKRIVVTRSREQASILVKKLSDLGADCIECPTIKIVPPESFEPLDNAIESLSTYEWLIFTSVNGVESFFKRLFEKGKDVRSLHHINTAVIGPETAKRLFDFGLRSDILPESYRAESIIKAFENKNINKQKILIPRAMEARPILPVELKKMGAIVDEIFAYRTEQVKENAEIMISKLKEKAIDIITFTSSSTVKNFKSLLSSCDFNSLIEGVTIAAIGPITADTAKELGFNVDIVAQTFTIDGLCEAILRYYSN